MNQIPDPVLANLVVDNSRLPPSSYRTEGVYTSTRFQPFSSYGESFYFLNHQHNWTNLYLLKNLPKIHQTSDLSTLDQIFQVDAQSPQALNTVNNLARNLSQDFKAIKTELSNLSSIDKQILEELKKKVVSQIETPPSYLTLLNQLTQRVERLQTQLKKLSQVFLPPGSAEKSPDSTSSLKTRG